MLETLTWTGSALRLLDQTKLPTQTVHVDITDEKQMWDAIKRLVVRGAPAIGVAAGYGAYLGIKDFDGGPYALMLKLNEVCDYLATSRPTAVNLFWALKRVQTAARKVLNRETSTLELKQRILEEAIAIEKEDRANCYALGSHGADLLKTLAPKGEPMQVLTHCNAGSLAAVVYGTALAPIYVGAEMGMKFHVFADETRPLLQGSRLTAYELRQNNIPVTVLCDNMAASLMREKKLDAIIVGTDRVAANGDVANKIGTMGVAILAKHFGIPFFVGCPTSTIDMSATTGKNIPIEHREAREVSHAFGTQTAPDGVGVFNPAFDVTPNELVTAIITERGVVKPPYTENLKKIMNASPSYTGNGNG
jgi:methylthioribose-1-phosphate isomerase